MFNVRTGCKVRRNTPCPVLVVFLCLDWCALSWCDWRAVWCMKMHGMEYFKIAGYRVHAENRRWILFWATLLQSKIPHTLPSGHAYILILSSHPRLRFQSGPFPSRLPTTQKDFHVPPVLLQILPSWSVHEKQYCRKAIRAAPSDRSNSYHCNALNTNLSN